MRGYACNDRPQPAFSETDMAPAAGNCEPDHHVVCRGIREAAGNKADNTDGKQGDTHVTQREKDRTLERSGLDPGTDGGRERPGDMLGSVPVLLMKR